MGVYDVLAEEAERVAVIFYNPNIEPMDEYLKRRDTCFDYAREKDIDFIEIAPDNDWEQVDANDEQRCFSCYLLRLGRTAQWAASNSYDSFATTLSISPWQNLEAINRAGTHIAQSYPDVSFAQYDFRNYYREAQNKARDLGIYRQNYCGCLRGRAEVQEQRKRCKKASASRNSDTK
ncbi:MAG: epoxyqueuosine reductase QueH [Coriobacteriia bacterium]|nr:epoxyqueuosine reductase QueH [Coriobacteriia bacterium]